MPDDIRMEGILPLRFIRVEKRIGADDEKKRRDRGGEGGRGGEGKESGGGNVPHAGDGIGENVDTEA